MNRTVVSKIEVYQARLIGDHTVQLKYLVMQRRENNTNYNLAFECAKKLIIKLKQIMQNKLYNNRCFSLLEK